MIFFMIGMVYMMVQHITDWKIWVAYITIWTYAEAIIAKEIKLKWWVWVLIIGGLSLIDLLIIQMIK